MYRMILLISLSLLLTGQASADWLVPLDISAGSARTSVAFGVQSGAGNGYDSGRDTPQKAYDGEVVYAAFPHPGWGVVIGGEHFAGFLRDVRGSLPQEFLLEVRSDQPTVTLSWPSAALPERTSILLRNTATGELVDLSNRTAYSFSPGGTLPVSLSFSVTQGDLSPPSVPAGVTVEERDDSLYVSWERNPEADLGGYKVHFGTVSGHYRRTIDVRNVTNFSLMNLDPEQFYYVAVSAYDQNGNESELSSEVSSGFGTDTIPPLPPVGLAVELTETALVFSWSAGLEPDLAGYRVHLGSEYGSYDSVRDVGLSTRYTLSGAVPGRRYYCAVSAIDEAGNESLLSTPVEGVLPEAPGVPEDEVIPEEGDTTVTAVGGAVSSVYIDLPGQGGTVRRTESTSGEQQDARPAGEEKKGGGGDERAETGNGRVGDTASPFEAVQARGGHQRLELDAHPWQLMTIPLRVSLNKPFAEFVALGGEISRLVGWDPVLQSYVKLKYPRPGVAFWLRAGQGYAVFEGAAYPHDQVVFSLEQGWNLLGSPFLDAASLAHVTVLSGEQSLTLAEAVAAGVLEDDLQSYADGAFSHASLSADGTIEPWRGYWVLAKRPCRLQIVLSKAEPSPDRDTRAEAAHGE